ncbi:ZIP zinc/iron transport family [Aureobasidium sp. EXF-3400]|nr:ZIP zinc/iron transport family [Aureobasidium sp. EXF-12344]KAI4784215.1 ZIP zinc/iron transport family [Aureobasidium sp. EXF-3400]
MPPSSDFDPNNVDLATADPAQVICALNASGNEYNGHLGARISALFVILIVSTAVTFFPVLAKRVRWLKIPLVVYLFARYFGAGVIIATAFIHLLDPAYSEIGPQTCVGMTGGWAVYSWPPAIVLVSVMIVFLMDLLSERYVETKYGQQNDESVEDIITTSRRSVSHRHPDAGNFPPIVLQNDDIEAGARAEVETEQKGHEDITSASSKSHTAFSDDMDKIKDPVVLEKLKAAQTQAYKQQIAAFLVLEFGVIFHSVVIGLNLGVVGSEFSTLYPVLVFHQSFEGLGIGARMSAIPFPKKSWLPWFLCTAYGLTTPIAIAIGLGVRTTYNPNSDTANIVSGILDSISAGILIYTGLVELLARDFLFDPLRTKDNKRLSFMVFCVLLGAGIMALLGKWA